MYPPSKPSFGPFYGGPLPSYAFFIFVDSEASEAVWESIPGTISATFTPGMFFWNFAS